MRWVIQSLVLVLWFGLADGWSQPRPPRPPSAPFIVGQLAPAGGSYLGVAIVEIDSDRASELGMSAPHGVEIGNVSEGSPAQDAGLERGDAILSYRGERISGVEHFVRLVRETPQGRKVTLAVLRDKSEIEIEVEIGRRQRGRPGNFQIRIPGFDLSLGDFNVDIPRPRMSVRSRSLGAEVENVRGQLAGYFGVEQGLLVRSVEQNTPADRAGLKAGDVIIEADGKSVRKLADLTRALRSGSGGDDKVPVVVMRNRTRTTLPFERRSRRGAGNPPSSAPARSVGRGQAGESL